MSMNKKRSLFPLIFTFIVLPIALLLPTLAWLDCSTGPKAAGVKLYPIGPVRLYHPPGESAEPRYDFGAELKFYLEPILPRATECSAFPNGFLDLTLLKPDVKSVLNYTLPVNAALFKPRDGGYVWTVPSASVNGAPATPFFVPAIQGTWLLDIEARCSPGGAASESTSLFFRAFPSKKSLPYWKTVLPAILSSPAKRIVASQEQLAETTDHETRMWLLEELHSAHRSADDPKAALDAALQWKEAAASAYLPSEEARALNAAHEMARELRDFPKAKELLDASDSIYRRYDFRSRMPESAYARCMLLDYMGQPLQALDSCSKAQDLAWHYDKPGIERLAELWELYILQRLGHLRLVSRRLTHFIEDINRTDATQLNNVGYLIVQGVEAGQPIHDDSREALLLAQSLFERSLVLVQKEQQQDLQADQLLGLGIVAILKENSDLASHYYAKAEQIARPDDLEAALGLRWVQGHIQLLNKKPVRSLETFHSLESDAARDNWVEFAGRAAFGSGESFRLLGKLSEAQFAYDRALAWLEKITAIRSPLHRNTVLTSRALWEARAIQVRLDLGQVESALEFAEHIAWKCRRSLSRSDVKAAPSGDISRLEAEIAAIDRRLVDQRQLPPSPARLASVSALDLEKQKKWADLEMARTSDADLPPPALDLETFRSNLPENSVALRFLLLPDEVVIWNVTADPITVRREALSRSELEKKVESYFESAKAGTPDRNIGKYLAKVLLGPYSTKPPETLLLVTDATLRTLPFASLPVGESPLIDHSTLLQLPQLLANPHQTSDHPAALDLIAVDPSRNLEWAFLEGSDLKEQLQSPRILAREDVTREALDEFLPQARTFHYAGHGETDATNPYLSHLLLAETEPFGLMELQKLQLPDTLVFLNACALGQASREGGGALGLADGFLSSGASALIATTYDVQDKVGGTMAKAYYAAFLKRLQMDTESIASNGEIMTVKRLPFLAAEALREAQNEVRRQSPAGQSAWCSYLLLTTASALQSEKPL